MMRIMSRRGMRTTREWRIIHVVNIIVDIKRLQHQCSVQSHITCLSLLSLSYPLSGAPPVFMALAMASPARCWAWPPPPPIMAPMMVPIRARGSTLLPEAGWLPISQGLAPEALVQPS